MDQNDYTVHQYVAKTGDEKTEGSSLEKGSPELAVADEQAGYAFDAADLDQVQRKLKQRHVQMIAVCTDNFIPAAFSLTPIFRDRWYTGHRSFPWFRRSSAGGWAIGCSSGLWHRWNRWLRDTMLAR